MAKNKVPASDVPELAAPAEEAPTSKGLRFESLKKIRHSTCCGACFKVLFVLLSIINIVFSLGVISLAVMASVTTRMYDAEQSHRLAAMVLLILTAGLALSLTISGLVALTKTNTKTLYLVIIILLILAVIQAVIVGVSVSVTPKEEEGLAKSLAESFKLSRDGSPRHVKLWDSTQYDLTCCGIYSPDNYRPIGTPSYFPPDVPISCCPNYDPSKSDMAQERERESCRARKSFYSTGCTNPVLEVFRETAGYVMGVSISLIVAEILLALVGSIVIRKAKRTKENAPVEMTPSE